VQKLESLGILAGGITHGFNNLFNGICGYIELAEKQTLPGQKVHPYLGNALAAFHNAKDLTQQRLTSAKGTPPAMQVSVIAKLIIDTANFALGGANIVCQSAFGTIFTIDLPVSSKEPAPTQEKNPAGPRKGGRYVLLMDDELFLLELLKEALEGMNYQVELSKNGEEAIQKYKTALISGQAFDAVILDLTVHGGMGGKTTVEKLLEIDPQVKGIASSGYSEDPIFANPKEYGFCGAIKKPYSIENLCEVLERVLGE
jgi:CheY-like chemotaxis protein